MSNSVYFTQNVHSNAPACQTTYLHLSCLGFSSNDASAFQFTVIYQYFDKTTDLLLGKLGSEWQNNLSAMIGLKPPLPH